MNGIRSLNRIFIIGLGLIGGSLAKSVRRVFPKVSIYAVEKNEKSRRAALMDGTVNKAWESLSGSVLDEVGTADIIFLCAGVESCKEAALSVGPYISGKDIIVTDVCSTKSEITDFFKKMKDINYIGGHPMTGSEKSGYETADAYLMENAIYVLCPMEHTKTSDMEFLTEIISSIGALPYKMDHREHDSAMARISHLPHITASALVNAAVLGEKDGMLRTLAAGGFKDITRIASGNPELWQGIVMSNKEHIICAIDDMIGCLEKYRSAIHNENKEQLFELLRSAGIQRESFETGRKAIMNLMYELNMNVPDKPGIIAEISSKLSENNINIRNIYIAESRDNELGCLRLAFDTKDARDRAALLLEVEL